MSEQASFKSDRPEFMTLLGLLPPFTIEDVHMAYRERAKLAHPDHGGSDSDFKRLHAAYDQAMEYAKFYTSRRKWLAAQVDRYVDQEAVIHAVQQQGGEVEVEHIDWLKSSIGEEFAALCDRLRGIRARNMADGDGFLRDLSTRQAALQFLLRLDVAGSLVTDEGLKSVSGLPLVRRLDLSCTRVSRNGVAEALKTLPGLRWLNVGGTRINCLACWRLRRLRSDVKIVSRRDH
jgi:hypothetical protein